MNRSITEIKKKETKVTTIYKKLVYLIWKLNEV